MVKNLFLFLACCTTFTLFAQQPSNYSLYMFNKFAFNPAYAGLDNSLSFTGVHRRQWSGVANSPSTQNINVHMPLYILSGGIGINVENDQLGLEQNLLATLSYNFQLPVGKIGILSIGASGGIFQKSLDGRGILTPEGLYEGITFNHNDNLPLPTSNLSEITPTFNAGIYFQTETFEAGLSAINIQEPVIEGTFFSVALSRNYFFNAAYQFDLLRSVSVHPSVLVKTDLIETQMEASILFKYNDNIFVGGSFRGYNANTVDAASLIVGLNLSEKIQLAYAYDFTLSALDVVSNGSHEIMINYNLGKPIGKGRLPKIIYNPRYVE
ncbi:MAG: PorP/SprF family type IX secretion system membrane protein [Bacteroidota bacterium]